MDAIQNNLDKVFKNPYVMAVLKVCLILYASQIAPRVPDYVRDTFKMTIVKLIAVFALAYISEVDFQLAILIAIILVLGTNLISGRGVFESYKSLDVYNNESQNAGIYQSDINKYTDLLGAPAKIGKVNIMESQTNIFPGCVKVSINDLLSLFDGDPNKLQATVSNVFFELQKSLPKDKSEENLLKMARLAGLPYNIKMINENAPLIATLLLNHGYKISEACQPIQ
jgi:multisubunit Na+/H+ antiporter MnhF subunit